MSKSKLQRPILEVVLPSMWLQKTVNGIEYWVHVPSRKGGIHIRGLARLCGITEGAIRKIIRNAKKAEGEVRTLRESDIQNLLKNKTIFLEEVRTLSPTQQGGPVKVICADVCGILIRYYAEKEHEAALKSAVAFMQLGIEQYIFIQVGFIPRPESIMLNNIEFLITKETVQVNKSRQEEARFFTNPITGECGIALQSLGFLCGGVAIKHIETFLAANSEPFLEPQQPEKIVKAPLCAAALQYFGYENKPRKTVAQHWLQTLEPIVPTLHQKTNYQATPHTDRESQMENRVKELEKENARLRQLAQIDDVHGLVNWHRLMGRLLERAVPELFWEVRLETETTKVPQFLDVLILQRPVSVPPNLPLPDGLTLDKEINLLSYKSHQESLTAWAIQELIGHYISYRKTVAAQHDQTLPDAERFQLYAVTTLYPQALVTQVGAAWQSTAQRGVYQLVGFGLEIVVIVTQQIPAALHNRPWNLLSHDSELIRYALELAPLPKDLERYFEALLEPVS